MIVRQNRVIPAPPLRFLISIYVSATRLLLRIIVTKIFVYIDSSVFRPKVKKNN
ncbi:hypothetical protein DCAR_0727575 [Daucus carota subsp. sativus]|uniref:Uncharacterized protein n=1 Tax=Daucus carota subsp. sativus TaxID=79200 RepID=A0AAF1B835_DAUCS|nr:hypothetical protein DCAR_0727575 [Daucus carota subsp. sativus]